MAPGSKKAADTTPYIVLLLFYIMARFSVASLLIIASSAAAFSSTSKGLAFCRTTANSNRSSTSLSMALTLYGSQGSRSPLVNWAANELNISVEAGDLSKNPHPFGQIPCLTDDNGVMVFESGAILNYLQSKAAKKGIHDDKKLAAVSSWISWANASLDPICFLETPDGKV
jgi:glutathione S-transferase